jgi:hypothetical protein
MKLSEIKPGQVYAIDRNLRYSPDAGGLVCHACGQPEEPDGLLGQTLGDQEGDGS